MASPTAIIYGVAFATFVYFLITKLFLRGGGRRSQKPLPPGPTPWPIVGNLPHLGPIPHHSIAALARKYGPLMHLRLGVVDVVVAASASVAAQFLKIHDANFSDRPPSSGGKYIAYNYQDMVFAPYGPRWRLLRKTRALANGGNAPVQLGQLLGVCTANALGRVLVGRRVFGDITGGVDPKADEFKSMVVELMILAGTFNVSDFVPALEWLDLQRVAAKMKNLHRRLDSFLSQILEEHGKTAHDALAGGHVDFLTSLSSLKLDDDGDGEGGKLTDTEIKALLLVRAQFLFLFFTYEISN
ncbi:unnamed protein product [Linum tenue]|uniref:Flavonoid 3'-hydroxylase n=1 Tax=Linum tenue TaxID=586396 RepID=A0AAV0GSJ6_9ROSI|nr:unnamed protein product [Linum tenue]